MYRRAGKFLALRAPRHDGDIPQRPGVRSAHRHPDGLATRALLRRAGDPAGMNRWSAALKTGAPVTNLIGALISLPEYVACF